MGKEAKCSDLTSDLVFRMVQIRKERKISQRELAEAIGIPQSTIGRIESYDTIPRLDTVQKIASYLGVSITFSDVKKEVQDYVSKVDKNKD